MSVKILAANLQDPEVILEKMAKSYSPETAKTFMYPFSKSGVCHRRTVEGIRNRDGNPTDIIWLYGLEDYVYHSCLSDRSNKVIVGATYLPGYNKFLADAGFEVADGSGTLDLIKKITVGSWLSRYFD